LKVCDFWQKQLSPEAKPVTNTLQGQACNRIDVKAACTVQYILSSQQQGQNNTEGGTPTLARKKDDFPDLCTIQSLISSYIKPRHRNARVVLCKKRFAIFPSPAGMSLIILSLDGNNLIIPAPGRVWSVTSRLGKGKSLTFFYSV
jgi:hypothetical protein